VILVASKRTTKRELGQPDAFHTGIDRIWQRFINHKTEFKLGAIIFLVLIVGGFAVSGYLKSGETAAQSMLEKIATDYQDIVRVDATSLAPKIKDDAEANDKAKKVEAGLKELTESKSSTKAGHLANYYLAELYFSQKKFVEAQQYFEAYNKNLSTRSPFRALVFSNLGYALEAQDKFAEAADYFVQSSQITENPNRDRDLFNAARLFEQVQKNDQASKYYQAIVNDFPDSSLVSLAKNKLAKLKG
jgi:tetratricopeptide (TPR) repeat protein